MITFEQFHPEGGIPIYLQIVRHIKRGIVSGTVANGDEVPSRRQLSALLGVNPNTIARAYTLLEEEGYVCSLPKKGAYVIFGEPQEREEPDKKAVIYALRDMGISKKTLLEWIEEVYKND